MSNFEQQESKTTLVNLSKLISKLTYNQIAELLNGETANYHKIIKRIQKNIQYLTTIKNRGDYYRKGLIGSSSYLSIYTKALEFCLTHKQKIKEVLPYLHMAELPKEVNSILILGDAHVFGREFASALVNSEIKLSELLDDIIHDAKSLINGNKRFRIVENNKRYKGTFILEYIKGQAEIVQLGDTAYPSIFEHFILLCLRTLGKYFYILAGDNDAFLAMNKFPSVSDHIAKLIMRDSVMSQISNSTNIFQLIQDEIAGRQSSLLIDSNIDNICFSHGGVYDVTLPKENKSVFTSKQELQLLGIVDQILDREKTDLLVSNLSAKLGGHFLGWIHGSDSSTELRKDAANIEVIPGIFQSYGKRIWISDNKQDPNEKTRALKFDIKSGFINCLNAIINSQLSDNHVEIYPS